MIHYTWWTNEMEQYLIDNYRNHGDKQLAQMFEDKFPKSFKWTLKHIEKKRHYMKLKRTSAEVHKIRSDNNKDGRQYKSWLKRNKGNNGEVRNWGGKFFIKIDGKWIPEHRYRVGAVTGEVVRKHEGTLVVIDRKSNQKLNSEIRANRHPELKLTIKALNQLKKIIYGKENTRPQGNSF
ncbi:MAG TPA: hypothetical protein VFU05_02790 [Cyclobacteriaceae bacterium]|nr:hypothetical protein [Cyclobacteriaceae bacterium]